MYPRGPAQKTPMRAPPPPLTAVSAFQRRASAHYLRRPPTGKIATSVITRVYAEKVAQCQHRKSPTSLDHLYRRVAGERNKRVFFMIGGVNGVQPVNLQNVRAFRFYWL